jgi:hypothetical protein
VLPETDPEALVGPRAFTDIERDRPTRAADRNLLLAADPPAFVAISTMGVTAPSVVMHRGDRVGGTNAILWFRVGRW